MYDPHLRVFLSPDNHIQAPYSTQSFNRFGYVWNNPLKYKDPSGESLLFAIGNLIAHAIRGDVDSFGDGLGYFFQGAIAGALSGPPVGTGLNIFTQGSFITGLGQGIFKGDWNKLENAGKIYLGNFYLDENRTFFGGVWQGFNRATRGKLNMKVGSAYSNIRNIFNDVDRVDFFGGATFATNENVGSIQSDGSGISMGSYINTNISGEINIGFDDYVVRSGLYMHEYGHTFDAQTFGLNYFYIIGIPSLISAAGDGRHNYYWTEKRANRFAARYFAEHFGVTWDDFENIYPR